MKKLLLVLTFCLGLLSGNLNASFPVTTNEVVENSIQAAGTEKTSDQHTLSEKELKSEMKAAKKALKKESKGQLDEMWILVLLWFFLGLFAAHRWYAKKPTGWNILFILTAGGCGIWAIVDLINILTGNFR